MKRRLTLKKSVAIVILIGTLLTINTLFLSVTVSHWTPQSLHIVANVNHLKLDNNVRELNISSKIHNVTLGTNRSRQTDQLEDFTMYSLVDPKEQFETSFKMFGENEKKKALLIFNKPGFEDEVSTNERLKTCEYNNCYMTSDKSLLKTADALLFIICKGGMGTKPPIDTKDRNPNQAWIFKCGETPINHLYSDFKSPACRNTMNWSISYRIDSDMPHPYGYLRTRVVPRKLDYEAIYKAKTKTALWVVSNCRTQSARDLYVAELVKNGLDVDIYGRCGPNKRISQEILQNIIPQYKFYLGFENSICNDYVTEKFFLYYEYNWVVVVRGGADYDRVLPTKTYINTAHYSNTSSLVQYLLNLANDKDRYIDFLRRKDVYEQRYEYGHRYSICELCRRLNNVSKFRKTYDNMRDYLENGQCRMPTDVKSSAQTSRFRKHGRVFGPK
ncbi:alpha-(1,3)-fucosyltransferase fut-5-like [Ruditapes philippinarum]|uniref:alpha-(1,3)-fucosyltransferase fut-5-like n=1 Tax=Ruditapes philippinarum TaxID=129788 RepID=UPI00295B0939|nr:alpha-(1,3)-fucosyltransferase fut-5-like [Ruditapes philippinarum]